MSTLNPTTSQTAKPHAANKAGRFLIRVAGLIGYLLAFLLAVILCLPVILLPISTTVPAWVWVPLGIMDVVLLILLFTLRPAWRAICCSLAGITLVGIMAIIASQFFTKTPPITDVQGNPIPGSIATLEKVNLNGSEQWISIRGRNINKPVLLFLAGGPGGSQLVTERRALAGLEDHFVVVNWEQPGAGKSFDAVDRSTLTPERYVSDGIALTEYLRERFDEEKIYVVGESWGSALGVWMVQRSPQYFHAFIGTGQMVAFLENDLMCYDFSIELARERGNTQKVKKLTKQGPPPYYGKGTAMKESAFLMDTFSYMNADPRISDDGFNTFQDLAGSEYGLYDKINWFRGALETIDAVYPQLWNVDFRQQATKLDVPVYFLLGRYDVNAPPVLAEEYFQLLEAPRKELFWFDHSGHNPWVTESDRFEEVIIDQVLPQTYQENPN